MGKKYFKQFFLSLNIPFNWLFSIIFNQNIICASKAKKNELFWEHRAKQNKQESCYFTVNFKTHAFCFPSNRYANDNKGKRIPIKRNCQPHFPQNPKQKALKCQPDKIFAPFPVKCFIKQSLKHLSSYKGFPSLMSVKRLQSLISSPVEVCSPLRDTQLAILSWPSPLIPGSDIFTTFIWSFPISRWELVSVWQRPMAVARLFLLTWICLAPGYEGWGPLMDQLPSLSWQVTEVKLKSVFKLLRHFCRQNIWLCPITPAWFWLLWLSPD